MTNGYISKKLNTLSSNTNVACAIGPSVNPFQNRENSTYENCFVRF